MKISHYNSHSQTDILLNIKKCSSYNRVGHIILPPTNQSWFFSLTVLRANSDEPNTHFIVLYLLRSTAHEESTTTIILSTFQVFFKVDVKNQLSWLQLTVRGDNIQLRPSVQGNIQIWGLARGKTIPWGLTNLDVSLHRGPYLFYYIFANVL